MKVIVLLLIVILFLVLAVRRVYDRRLRQHLEFKKQKELQLKLESEKTAQLPALSAPTPVTDSYFPLTVVGEYQDAYGSSRPSSTEGLHTVSLTTNGGVTLFPSQLKSTIERTLLSSIRSKLLTANVRVSIPDLKEDELTVKVNGILYRGGEIASQNSHIVTSSSCWDPDFLSTKLPKVTLILSI